ncbi:hypothetical protein PgNI_06193 [Pyricularia grisea]|uniref:Uncharacterized protein n=1 Tax=Pyricularia grisea TaxID=148305 RepID=A0A6P8B801_PYRGI|nr:hypothetical protein PgNI_06193 [Pyricularia grisea]TLD11244.1 hypothetical protein PgNI_06193 [Pyricularia grisea]
MATPGTPTTNWRTPFDFNKLEPKCIFLVHLPTFFLVSGLAAFSSWTRGRSGREGLLFPPLRMLRLRLPLRIFPQKHPSLPGSGALNHQRLAHHRPAQNGWVLVVASADAATGPSGTVGRDRG